MNSKLNDELWRLISSAFISHAKRPAVEIDGHAYTYEDVWLRASAFVAQHADVVRPGSAIGILPQRSIETYVAVLAAVFMGRPYVSLNMRFPIGRQQAIVDQSRCSLIIADHETEHRRRDLVLPTRELSLDDFEICAGREGEQPAYFMFTSGTTGAPKGVANSRNNLAAYLKAIDAILQFPPGSRCSQFFELSFDVSVHDIFYTWFSGGVLCPMSANDGTDFIAFAAAKKLESWYSVPSVIAFADRIGSIRSNCLPNLKWALFVGEALTTTLAKKCLSACPNAKGFNLYGPTEATITATGFGFDRRELDAVTSSTIPIGWANPGSETIVVGGDGVETIGAAEGELWIGGPQVALGYVNNPEETAKKFVERDFQGLNSRRWYRTGDRVVRTQDQGYLFLGRLDDQIKIRGYRAELLEVEESLRKAAGVSEVAAVPWPVVMPGNADGVVGFIAGEFDSANVLRKCAEMLPSYMVPTSIVRAPTIPLNQNGKVDRKALVQAYLEVSDTKIAGSSVNSIEEKLVSAWSAVFPNRQISVDTSFAALAGDSLSYVGALIAAEQVVGSMPADWTQLTIAEIARTSTRSNSSDLVRLDIPTLLRSVGIAIVLFSHLNYINIPTGATHILAIVSGFLFASIQLHETAGLTRRMIRSSMNLIAICLCVVAPPTLLVDGHVSITDLLMIDDFGPGDGYLWYIHALIHVYVVVAVISFTFDRIGPVLEQKRLKTFAIFIGTLGLGAAVAAVKLGFHLMSWVGAQVDEPSWDRWVVFRFFFLFGAGAFIGHFRSVRARLAGIFLVKLGGSGFMSLEQINVETYAPIVSAVAISFLNNIRIHRIVAAVIYRTADISIYMYLIQPMVSKTVSPYKLDGLLVLGLVVALSFAVDVVVVRTVNLMRQLNLRKIFKTVHGAMPSTKGVQSATL